MSEDVTRFGAVWEPVERCAAVIRARTARHGAELAPYEPVPAAAAVVAVEAWMAALDETSLENPARHGIAAVAALAASYTLLTGGRFGEITRREPTHTPDDRMFTLGEELSRRVQRWGLDPGEVIGLACTALAMGDEDPRIAALVDVLESCARTA